MVMIFSNFNDSYVTRITMIPVKIIAKPVIDNENDNDIANTAVDIDNDGNSNKNGNKNVNEHRDNY